MENVSARGRKYEKVRRGERKGQVQKEKQREG